MYYPDMEQEILDAVHLMYEDTPNIEAKCYLYLKSLKYSEHARNRLTSLSVNAEQSLIDMGRCRFCGNKLRIRKYKQIHTELGPNVYEINNYYYCPECGEGE